MEAVSAFTIAPGTRFRRHEHGVPHVVAVLSGGFVEREGGGWRDVGPGTIRVSDAARHDCDFGRAGARCLVLELEPGALEPPAAARFLPADGWLADLAHRLEAAAAAPDPAYSVPGLTAELVAQIARRLGGRAGPPPRWLGRVRELLHDTAGTASVPALAREAGVHRVHLARTFRDHLGVPVTVYARQLRLEAARDHLAEGLPPARAAARAGFADQSHLTRAMRSAWGVTPGALRRGVTGVQDDRPPGATRSVRPRVR